MCCISYRIVLNRTEYIVRFNSIQFNSIQFNSIQFKSNQIKSNQIKSIQFNSIQFNAIQSTALSLSIVIRFVSCSFPSKVGYFVHHTYIVIHPLLLAIQIQNLQSERYYYTPISILFWLRLLFNYNDYDYNSHFTYLLLLLLYNNIV